MPTQSPDTSPAAEQVLLEGYRRMSPAQKLERVRAMTQAIQQLALARIRAHYGPLSEREVRMRLAALWLDADTMRRVFGWDPRREGY